MKQKHFFASANTGNGFFMNFDKINTQKGFVYVIKGGSGTGKSSLMKKVGQHFLNKGYDIEFVHCSTDTNSLDGVRICDFNILILDGTFPHVVEANVPGVEDKILNVGSFVKDDIKKHEATVCEILAKKQVCYKIFYKLLSAAEKMQSVLEILQNKQDFDAEFEAQKLFNQLNLSFVDRKPTQRKLFLSAIGKNGKTNLIFENEFKQILKIKSNLFCASKIFEVLNEKIKKLGYDTILFCDVLNPKFVESLCVPSTSTLIVFEDEKSDDETVNFCKEQIVKILAEASKILENAKKQHFKLEEIYIKHTNFKEVDKLTKKLILEIEKRLKSN